MKLKIEDKLLAKQQIHKNVKNEFEDQEMTDYLKEMDQKMAEESQNQLDQIITNSIEEVVLKLQYLVDETKDKTDRLVQIHQQFLESFKDDIEKNILNKDIYIEANNQNIKLFKYEEKLKVYQESVEILQAFKQQLKPEENDIQQM
ncbi:hypothetical protein OXYTRIMIC_719 [Oxytricha trifallax]|uniref:Uncharacterized protein n=1 Tax=Oxytricha trifallax TaxID=1172189 RepID=A0A073ICC7_9SPIT|nr:hypothetical protein OXYTRIMIC_719 [Oxytricha trifallax]